MGFTTHGGYGVDIALVREGDRLAIRGDSWIAQPEWAFLCSGGECRRTEEKPTEKGFLYIHCL